MTFDTSTLSFQDALSNDRSVTIHADGLISDAPGNDDTTDITTPTLPVLRAYGIGNTQADALNINVNLLNLNQIWNNNVFISEADGLTFGTITIVADWWRDFNVRQLTGNVVQGTSPRLQANDFTFTVDQVGAAIGTAANPILIQAIDHGDTADLSAKATGNGGMFISENDHMYLNLVDARSGDIGLTAVGGHILQVVGGTNIRTTGTLTLDATYQIGWLGVEVPRLIAHSHNGYGTYISDLDGIELADVDTAGGDIQITSTGTILALDVVTPSSLSLTASSGDIKFGAVTAYNAFITASTGSILDDVAIDDNLVDITTTGTLQLQAPATGQTAGTATNSLDIQPQNGTLNLNTRAGFWINILSGSDISNLIVNVPAGATQIINGGGLTYNVTSTGLPSNVTTINEITNSNMSLTLTNESGDLNVVKIDLGSGTAGDLNNLTTPGNITIGQCRVVFKAGIFCS